MSTLASPAGRRELLVALALAVTALALCLPGHLDSGLWYDEIVTLLELRDAPLAAVVSEYRSDNQHPLYSLAAWLSLRALGESAWALRLPAVLFGALAVGAFYLYAVRVTRHGEALFAAALLATSYHHAWFSQNARGYTGLLLFTLVAAHAFERLVEEGDRRALVPYAVALALAAYTHLTAVFLAVGHLAALVVRRRFPGRHGGGSGWRLPFAGVALGGALAALLYAPILRPMADHLLSKSAAASHAAAASGAPEKWRSPLWALYEAIASFGLGAAEVGAIALASALLAWGAYDYARQGLWRLVAWGVPGAALAGALLLLGRAFWPRFFFFLAGFLLLLLVRGVARLGERLLPASRRAAPVAALALLAAWSALLPRAWALPKQDFVGARDHLARIRRPGEVVAAVGLTVLPYRMYYATNYVEVNRVEELEALARSAPAVYVVSTLPEYLRTRSPQLAAAVAARGREIARFPGSVGDGDVVVLRLEPGAAAP